MSSPSRIHELVYTQAHRTPTAIAVIAGADRLSYAELVRRAGVVTAGLLARRLDRNQLVGVCLPRTGWLIPGLLGVLGAGAGYVPMDPAYPPDRIRLIAEDAALRWVLAAPETRAAAAASGAETILIDNLADSRPGAPLTRGSPADLAYVLYTSGSTGRPKGAAIEHRNALAFLSWAMAAYTPGEFAGTLGSSSICFDFSILELFAPLATGGAVILAENLLALPRLPARDQVTMLCGVPSAIAALVDSELPAGIRTLSIGGEVLTRALCDRIFTNTGVRRILNVYGPTECTTACLVHDVDRRERGEPALGQPIGGAELTVRDPHGHPVPDGTAGELWIAGPGMGRGYLNRPELTAQRYLADTAVSGGRRYRSGDLVRRINGRYHFVGRMDDQVKVRGFRVELGEVQAALAEHPSVRIAAVLAPADPTGTRRLVGYVEPHVPVTEAELTGYLRERLPGHLVPSRIAVLAHIPRNPNGKVDRLALPQLDTYHGDRPHIAPRDEVEARLATMTAEALGLAQVGVTDNFTELGGHSLAATRLLAKVGKEFGVTLAPEWFLGNPTVSALAEAVAGADGRTSAALTRHHGRTTYPLTDMQRQFWAIRQFSRHETVTAVAFRLALTGTADAAAVQTALTAIATRHEVLRSVVRESGTTLTMQVQPVTPVPVAEHDLRWLPVPQRLARAEEIAREFAGTSVDPGRDTPLLRAAVLRTQDDAAELLVLVDHIAFDGVSIGVLMAELTAGIAESGAGAAVLEPPALQAGDIALGELADDSDQDSLSKSWSAELAGAQPPYDLARRRRPGLPDHRGARIIRPLAPELLTSVTGLATQLGATPPAVLLAALAILIDGLTGRPDVLIGVAASDRGAPGTERTIGPLLSVLPVRIRWDDDPSFGALAVRTLTAVRRALALRALPAADVAAQSGVARPPGSSLTPVVLSVQPDDTPLLVEHGDIKLELLGELDTGAAQNDLAVYVNDTARGPQLHLEYALDLFEASDAEAFAERYLRILSAATADPGRPVSGFDLLDAAERSWLLAAGTGTPLAQREVHTVVHSILGQARRRPDAAAVLGQHGRLSYAELAHRAQRLAAALVAHGVRPNSAIGVGLPRDQLLPASLLGVLQAGAGYVPLDPAMPSERLRCQLDDAGIALVLTSEQTAPALRQLPGITVLDVDSLVAAVGDAKLPEIQPDWLAYILFTSGSTGRPKGVEVTHANLAAYVAAMHSEPGYRADDVFLAASPIWFDLSCFDLWVALAAGARTVVVERDLVVDGPALLGRLQDAGVTAMDVPPTLLRLLLTAGWSPGQGNQRGIRLISGGEPLDSALAGDLLERVPELWNAYGPTETTVTVTMHRVQSADDGPIPIGHPVPGARIYLCDRTGRLVPPGTTGELWIGGPGVARGYCGRPELTATAFVADPVDPSGRCYRSGDLARWTPDGALEFAGRRDDQIKIRGHRIELAEIELVLRDHPGVADIAVAVASPGTPDARLVGYVVQRPGVAAEPGSLSAHAGNYLPGYMLPGDWVLLDRLPTTSSGKIDRQALPAPGPGKRDLTPPGSPMSRLIAQIWSEVLGRPDVGETDDFFALGGHSLAVGRVMAELRNRLGAELPARMLFERPTLAGFAAEVERHMLDELSSGIEHGIETAP